MVTIYVQKIQRRVVDPVNDLRRAPTQKHSAMAGEARSLLCLRENLLELAPVHIERLVPVRQIPPRVEHIINVYIFASPQNALGELGPPNTDLGHAGNANQPCKPNPKVKSVLNKR